MYTTCPKCGYVRDPDDRTPRDRCPACGVVFDKWLKLQMQTQLAAEREQAEAELREAEGDEAPAPTPKSGLRSLILAVVLPTPEDRLNPFVFYGRAFVYLVAVIWGLRFLFMDFHYSLGGQRIDIPAPEIGESLMHLINLPFHEAGHVLFRPLGDFMTVLGGSLMQVLVPLIVMFTFLIKEREPFAAALGLWWTGQSLMDLAPYINDARNGQMLLLGGNFGADNPDFHDWHNLLERMGLLHWDHGLADLTDFFGAMLMLLSLAWAGYVLYRQYPHLDRR